MCAALSINEKTADPEHVHVLHVHVLHVHVLHVHVFFQKSAFVLMSE